MSEGGAAASIACAECGRSNPPASRFCSGCGSPILLGDTDPILGTVVAGRYRIARLIGEGGMGSVYLAEQPMGTTTRRVAVKVLKGAATDAARTRFIRECETVVQLTHPNTIRFYDFGALDDGRLFIVMEFVEGRTLTKRIEQGPLPHASVDRIVTQIGGALAEAHRRGIVHRDLKPDNVILVSDEDDDIEHVKVLDFGIAKRREDEERAQPEVTAAGTIVGTPAYMSPEQLSGLPVDARSDLYALGLITFEMLTGQRPFRGKTPLEWATAHMTKPVPPFDDYPSTRLLPEGKRAAILRALAKDPGERQPTVRRYVEELTGASTSSSMTSGSGHVTVRATSSDDIGAADTRLAPSSDYGLGPRRTSPALLVGLAAGLGAALVLGGWWLLRPPERTPPEDVIADAGVAVLEPEPDAGPPEPRMSWLQILTAEDDATDAALALGPPDGRCAVIRPNGKLLLELTAGLPRRGDGTEAPDIHVFVDEERSGPYRVDVAASRTREEYVNVASDMVGSAPLDIDQVEVESFRYIRIKNRARNGIVCVDAIGIYVH